MLRLLLCLALSEIALGQGFAPENDLYKFDDLELSNVSESEFHSVLESVVHVYEPIVEKLGGKLVLKADWKDSTVNAYALREGAEWQVHMFGGLARRKEIIADAYQMVFCHELGHHVAGFPYVQQWASNEGNSDWYSSQCVKLLWEKDYERNAQASLKIPAYPRSQCDKAYAAQRSRELCYRVALASKSLADFLSNGSAKYEAIDKTVVARTNHGHPGGQCRLTTYLESDLCPTKVDFLVIPKDEKEALKYSCPTRPRCWFKPTLYRFF